MSTPDTLKEMYPEERRGEILRLINQSGRASVTELSGQFGVSEVTIRADLQALADRRFLDAVPVGGLKHGRQA